MPEQIQPGGPLMFWTCVETLRWTVPILTAALAASLLAGYAQGGFVFAPEALAIKGDRFNPATKLKQLFSLDQRQHDSEVAASLHRHWLDWLCKPQRPLEPDPVEFLFVTTRVCESGQRAC